MHDRPFSYREKQNLTSAPLRQRLPRRGPQKREGGRRRCSWAVFVLVADEKTVPCAHGILAGRPPPSVFASIQTRPGHRKVLLSSSRLRRRRQLTSAHISSRTKADDGTLLVGAHTRTTSSTPSNARGQCGACHTLAHAAPCRNVPTRGWSRFRWLLFFVRTLRSN